MGALPLSFDTLQDRLSALQESTTQARELIAQLSNLTYDDDVEEEATLAADLAAETVQIIDESRDELELLEEEVTDLSVPGSKKPGKDSGRGGARSIIGKVRGENGEKGERQEGEQGYLKNRLLEGVKRAREEIKRTRVELRRAQNTTYQRREDASRRWREEYLREVMAQTESLQNSVASLPSPSSAAIGNGSALAAQEGMAAEGAEGTAGTLTPRSTRSQLFGRTARKHKRINPEDPSAETSDNITSALLRMHASMAAEVERSTYAAKMVSESTASLRELTEKYDSLDSLLQKSKGLLGVLVKSSKSDAWYLQTTVYMLLATLAWLAFRRWFYGPLWWLVWLPLKLIFRSGVALSRVGIKQAGVDIKFDEIREGAPDMAEGFEKEVPTIRVGAGIGVESKGVEEADELMVEQIGKIVDRSNGEGYVLPRVEEDGEKTYAGTAGEAPEVTVEGPLAKDEL